MALVAARKIIQGIIFHYYNIRRMIFGVTEPISDDFSTVLWPDHRYPETGVSAKIMSKTLLYSNIFPKMLRKTYL